MPVVTDYQIYYRTSERDYYEVLGIAPSASAEEIRRAYHKLAFQCHPDRNGKSKKAHKKCKR